MAHFIIQLVGSDEDPTKSGDLKSWFYYYKWRPDEEDDVFYPVPTDTFDTIKEGDTLWFSMDNVLVGKVTLTKVEQDYFNDRKELWFNTKSCTPTTSRVELDSSVPTGELSGGSVVWFEHSCA